MTTDSAEVELTPGDGEREPDPSDSLRTFGAVAQALREHAGLSRVEFGERVSFSKHTVHPILVIRPQRRWAAWSQNSDTQTKARTPLGFRKDLGQARSSRG
jgi:hypothetical protein